MTTYIVCQNGDCATPHVIEDLGSTQEELKNIDCIICGAIVIDYKGHGDMSLLRQRIPYRENDSPERKRAKKIQKKRKKLVEFEKEILEMEETSFKKWREERGE